MQTRGGKAGKSRVRTVKRGRLRTTRKCVVNRSNKNPVPSCGKKVGRWTSHVWVRENQKGCTCPRGLVPQPPTDPRHGPAKRWAKNGIWGWVASRKGGKTVVSSEAKAQKVQGLKYRMKKRRTYTHVNGDQDGYRHDFKIKEKNVRAKE